MGQFQSRPEDPSEWAGLPSEPLDRSDATNLEASIGAADALQLGLGSGLGSILIPTTPLLPEGELPAPTEPDEPDDA